MPFEVCKLMQNNRIEDVAKFIGHRALNTTFSTYYSITSMCFEKEWKWAAVGHTAQGTGGRHVHTMAPIGRLKNFIASVLIRKNGCNTNQTPYTQQIKWFFTIPHHIQTSAMG